MKKNLFFRYVIFSHLVGTVLKEGAWMLASCFLLLSSCSSEVLQGDDSGSNPSDPSGSTEDRREVLLTLKNKLTVKNGSSRAIAMAEENAISTLDVYVFGSETEGGTYTFQERFSYRDDASGPIPSNSSELILASGADGSSTTGLLSLKRGLFVKLYCVANDTVLIDPATGNALSSNDLKPIVFHKVSEDGTGSGSDAGSNPGSTSGSVIATAGYPTESTFLSFHTSLLTDVSVNPAIPASDSEIIQTPLVMSGALTTPLDLTDNTSASRLQAGFRLTRLAARFDIINDAEKSKFTIQSISMGNGRRGASFFPISVYGSDPANADELITYSYRLFSGVDAENPDANQGLSTGAFYSYPSLASDQAYLILRGQYRINKTELKDVSYQVPFTRTGVSGEGAFLDITSNHRYTLNITQADEYSLEVNIDVTDWDDEPIDHYDPMNRLDPVMVRDLLPFNETEFDAKSRTVSMQIDYDQECSFTVHTASNLELDAKLEFLGTPGAGQPWLKMEKQTPDADYVHKGDKAVKYKVWLDPGFKGGNSLRAILRFTDVAGVASERIIIDPKSSPSPGPIPYQENTPENRLNRFCADDATLYMYRVTNSCFSLRMKCREGVEPPADTDWYKVERTDGTDDAPIFKVTLTDRDVVLLADEATLNFSNKKWPAQIFPVKIKLVEATLSNPRLDEGKENASLDAEKRIVTLKAQKDSKCKLSIETFDDIRVAEVEYESAPSGDPSDDWLMYTGKLSAKNAKGSGSRGAGTSVPWTSSSALLPRALSATSSSVRNALFSAPGVELPEKRRASIEFSINPDTRIKHFGRAKVTLHNTSLGPDAVYYVEPGYIIPSVTGSTPMSSLNNYDAAEEILYMVQPVSGSTSEASISVYSPGGSWLELPSELTADVFAGEAQIQNYTLKWTGGGDMPGDNAINLTIVNASDDSKKKTIAVKLVRDLDGLKVSSPDGDILLSDIKYQTATLTMPIIKDRQFTLSMKYYGAVPVLKTKPAWLEQLEIPVRSVPDKSTITYTFRLIEDAVNFDDTKLVFSTQIGNDMEVTIDRQFQAPVVIDGGEGSPAVNSFIANGTTGTVNLYRTREGTETNRLIKVYSLGGSKVESSTSNGWFKVTKEKTEGNHTVYYRVGHNATQTKSNYATNTNESFYVRNNSDVSKSTNVAMKFKSAQLRFSADYNCVNFNMQSVAWNGNSNWANCWSYFDIKDTEKLRGKDTFYFRIYSPAGINFSETLYLPNSNNCIYITKTTAWTESSGYDEFKLYIPRGYVGGNTFRLGVLDFPSNVPEFFYAYKFDFVNYHPIAGSYFARYKDSNTGKYWYDAGRTYDTPEQAISNVASQYPGWRLPTKEEYRSLAGWTKNGTNGNWNDEGWYNPNNSYTSSIFWTIFSKDYYMKCFSNDAGWRFDAEKPGNRAGYDVGSYGDATRHYILISP